MKRKRSLDAATLADDTDNAAVATLGISSLVPLEEDLAVLAGLKKTVDVLHENVQLIRIERVHNRLHTSLLHAGKQPLHNIGHAPLKFLILTANDVVGEHLGDRFRSTATVHNINTKRKGKRQKMNNIKMETNKPISSKHKKITTK